jgi:hypothetical protein
VDVKSWHLRAKQMRDGGRKIADIAEELGKSGAGVTKAIRAVLDEERRAGQHKPTSVDMIVTAYFENPNDNAAQLGNRLGIPALEVDAALNTRGLPMCVARARRSGRANTR